MPTRFYPDTNTIHLIRSTWKPNEFDRKARTGGYTLCLGHQIYELARSFLYDHPQQAVKDAFAFLLDIECAEFLPAVEARMDAEIHLANTGIPLVTVVNPLNQVATKQELWKLARGSSDNACQFISKRESSLAKDKESFIEQNQAALGRARLVDRKRTAAIKTFEMLQEELRAERPEWLKNSLVRKGLTASASAIDRVLSDPMRFPVLNTFVFCQEYMYFITAFHNASLGKDTPDDLRLLVESSACDLFVTNDTNLLSRSKRIRPFKCAISWMEFKATFDSK